MSLTYGLLTVKDLFKKLERDSKLLDEEVTSDRMFNFVVTGYSMIDWIKNDPSVPQSAKDENHIKRLRCQLWLKVCGNLANASKHFKLTRRGPITSSSTSSQGFGVGRFGKGGFGIGEESIEILLNDGTKYDGLDLVNGVLNEWRQYFKLHGV